LTFAFGKGAGTEDLTIKLLPGAGPEVKNASGTSTLNWESTTLVDNLYSGFGDDNITGNLLDNIIYGSQGSDTISSLSGDDFIYVARDGEKDYVNCGSGFIGQDHDYVVHDSSDVVSNNCEEKHLPT
jgi:Ca2+-binding RTX toxin-like protein